MAQRGKIMTRLKLSTLGLSGVAFLLIQGCATVDTGATPTAQSMQDAGVAALETADLYDLHDGDPVRMSWVGPRGSGTAEYNLDGTWSTGGDSGEYYIATGQVCSMLEETRPEMRCVTYYPTENPNEYMTFDEDGNWVGTLVYE